MKVNLKPALNMGKELKLFKMEIFIKANMLMEGLKDMVNICGLMAVFIRVNLKMD
jgi:hypothetical protein